MRRTLSVLGLFVAIANGPVHAQPEEPEVPAFDRPGIGLGTGIVRRGALAVELGVPSYTRDRDRDAVQQEQAEGEITLRTGLFEGLELQVSSTPWQRQRTRSPGEPSQRLQGGGDTLVAVKWAPSTGSHADRIALLASSTLARGDAEFTDGRQYALAGTYEHDFDDRWSGALYASHAQGSGERSTIWSPSLTLALTPRVSAFVEAGFTRQRGEPRESVAGTGVTFMVSDSVQVDSYVDVGLDADSPDLEVGLGISAYFD